MSGSVWLLVALLMAPHVSMGRHVGLARVEQQYYIYSSTFDPAKYKDEASRRIRIQHGCSNVVDLLNVVQSSKLVPVLVVKVLLLLSF